MLSASEFHRTFATRARSRTKSERRFLHVGTLRLDQPLQGQPDLPDELRSLYATATRKSLNGVFDLAISEDVDAILFAGGLPNPVADGFRPLALIYSQCRRLEAARIPVVAALRSNAPQFDASGGYEFLRQPSNFAVIATDPDTAASNSRGSRTRQRSTVVTIGNVTERNRIDIGSPAMKSNARFRITFDRPKKKKRHRFDYVALGKSSHANTEELSKHGLIAHDPGSPQGFGATETGRHGVTLVTLHRDRAATIEPRACDVVRNHVITIEITDGTTDQALQYLFERHTHRLANDSSVRLHVVTFDIRGHGSLANRLRDHRPRKAQLGQLRDSLAGLHHEANQHRTRVWISNLTVSPDETQRSRERELAGPSGRFVRTVEQMGTTRRDSVISNTLPMLASRS